MVTAVLSQAPLDPSADEAQQWARSELAKAIYNNEPTVLERIVDWFTDLWSRLQEATGTLGPVATPLIVVGILGLVLVVGFVLGGPVRRRRRAGASHSAVVLDGDERSAGAIRTAAERAAASGEYSLAVLERFRALVRSLDERALLIDRPGRTAHEAAAAATSYFPAYADAVSGAARKFDAVCYGHQAASQADYSALYALDEDVSRARPAGRNSEMVPAR